MKFQSFMFQGFEMMAVGRLDITTEAQSNPEKKSESWFTVLLSVVRLRPQEIKKLVFLCISVPLW